MSESDGVRRELYQRILATQERFAYFFLAASGSAIAFALVRTEDQPPARWMLPVGVALVCWGVSFTSVSGRAPPVQGEVLLGNWKSLDVQQGTERITASNPSLVEPALERLRTKAEEATSPPAGMAAGSTPYSSWVQSSICSGTHCVSGFLDLAQRGGSSARGSSCLRPPHRRPRPAGRRRPRPDSGTRSQNPLAGIARGSRRPAGPVGQDGYPLLAYDGRGKGDVQGPVGRATRAGQSHVARGG